MTIFDFFAIAVGGFTGAILRYALSTKLNTGASIPYGTLLANSLGCLLIGFVFALELPIALTFLLVSGFCGALTTFSTWVKELLGMMRLNEWQKAILYLVGTMIVGVGLIFIGHTLGGFVTN